MEYRAASVADTAAIALLHAESWRHTYRGILRSEFLDGDVLTDRVGVWSARLRQQRPEQFVFVATDADQVVGFICAVGREDRQWGSLIDNLHVARGYQRRGIGTVLMREAGRWLAANYGGLGVYLWVMELNQNARAFYERLLASNAGVIDKENPGGGFARNCRYTWSSPEGMVAAASNMRAG